MRSVARVLRDDSRLLRMMAAGETPLRRVDIARIGETLQAIATTIDTAAARAAERARKERQREKA